MIIECVSEVPFMKAGSVAALLVACLLLLSLASPAAKAAEPPKGPITIKLEGAKMPPVVFSHETHEKRGIECIKCHHKDPQDPKACTTCHEKEAKGAAIPSKDAFHNTCLGCHKETAQQGLKAPAKCMECHKR
jgi:hypothetical protein